MIAAEWAALPVLVVTAKQLDPTEERWLRDMAQQVIGKGQSGYVTLVERCGTSWPVRPC